MAKAASTSDSQSPSAGAAKKKTRRKTTKKAACKSAAGKDEASAASAEAAPAETGRAEGGTPNGTGGDDEGAQRKAGQKADPDAGTEAKAESASQADPGKSDQKQEAKQSQQKQGGQGQQQSQQHAQQQGQQQGGGDSGKDSRRRKRKKRKGQGGYSHGGGGGHRGDGLPSDEVLEREAAQLEQIAAEKGPVDEAEQITITELQRMGLDELFAVAEREGLEDFKDTPKQELIFKILKTRATRLGIMFGEGTLEIMSDGFGFLRSPELSYLPGPDDIYVSPTHIRRHGLRRGMNVRGAVRPPRESDRYFALLRVDSVNGRDPRVIHDLVNFEDLTPHHPEARFVLETTPDKIETRVVDLVAPIGKGQRALIVAPPRTGKTVLLQRMTQAISTNYPGTKIFVLLVDERPEEVTDFKRNTDDSVEVVASTFDEQPGRHVAIAEVVIEKARRMVEFGDDVVIFLDSITRLARAYNTEMPHSGRIMTGGLDSNALQRPKKFFGAARAIEGGGSLTIIGTALVDTGSKMDEVIFEEFKGTGNSELHLDRRLIEKRIFPAIDVSASGTRREELLLDPKELELVHRLRKVLSDMNVVEAMELLKNRLSKVKTNAEFLVTMALG